MKTIIAGSRSVTDYKYLEEALECFGISNITEVVSGRARGADTLGEEYAIEEDITLALFPADWDKHGRRAGPIRNIEMGNYADQLLALWDGKSRGTQHMIEYMKKLGKPVFVYNTSI